jgi:hypothetical protein
MGVFHLTLKSLALPNLYPMMVYKPNLLLYSWVYDLEHNCFVRGEQVDRLPERPDDELPGLRNSGDNVGSMDNSRGNSPDTMMGPNNYTTPNNKENTTMDHTMDRNTMVTTKSNTTTRDTNYSNKAN